MLREGCRVLHELSEKTDDRLDIAEDLSAPLPFLFVTLMSAEDESRIHADENDDQFRKPVEENCGPPVFRGIVHECLELLLRGHPQLREEE
jgi:hypothetical protein